MNYLMVWVVEGTPVPVPDEFFCDGGVKIPEYRVSYDSTRKRVWLCECPHNTYRKVQCKHITQCLPELRRHQEMLSWWHGVINRPLTPEDRLQWLS